MRVPALCLPDCAARCGFRPCSHACAQIQQFVHNPAFNPQVVSRSSKSAAVLGKWVIAMDAYQHVKKVGTHTGGGGVTRGPQEGCAFAFWSRASVPLANGTCSC